MKTYYCMYCSVAGKRSNILSHETKCKYNPDNKQCHTCIYLKPNPHADWCELNVGTFDKSYWGEHPCNNHEG